MMVPWGPSPLGQGWCQISGVGRQVTTRTADAPVVAGGTTFETQRIDSQYAGVLGRRFGVVRGGPQLGAVAVPARIAKEGRRAFCVTMTDVA